MEAVESPDSLKQVANNRSIDMTIKFTLQIEVVLGDQHAEKAIEVARQAYNSGGRTSALVGDEEQPIPAEQFIGCPEQALMELVETNPLFQKAGYHC